MTDDTVVSFYGQGLKLNNAQDAVVIAEKISACEQLITLNLEGNTLGIEAAEEIGQSLRNKSSLKFALLKDLFTGRLKTEIPDALKHLTEGIQASGAQLEELDLSDNAFGPIGMKALVDFLGSPACSQLRVLRLNNNGLGIQGANLLASVIGELQHLEIFICGRNRLENDGSSAVGRSLQKINTLKQLEMPQNGIRVEGIHVIAEAVQRNQKMEILNLNDNTMTEKGGEAIADALKQTGNVKIVNFGDCLLRSGGCVAVLNALEKGGSLLKLEKLTLNGNEISGDEAVSSILFLFSAENLNEQLEIDLSNNNFGEEAIEKLAGALAGRINILLNDDEGLPEEDDSDNQIASENISTLLNSNDTTLDDLCDKFVDISIGGFDDDKQQLSGSALKTAEEIIDAGVKRSNNPYNFANTLLVSMGLLKDEEKKYKQVKDLRGPFLALSHSTTKLDKAQKETLQLFIGNRPHKVADQTGKIKHQLLQSLFS